MTRQGFETLFLEGSPSQIDEQIEQSGTYALLKPQQDLWRDRRPVAPYPRQSLPRAPKYGIREEICK